MAQRGDGKPKKIDNGKWEIRFMDEANTRRRRRFDRYNDALSFLRRREKEIQEIRRGQRVGVVPNKTFDELCDHWLTHRAAKKKSGKDDASIIRKHLRPNLGRHRLTYLVMNPDLIDDFTDICEDVVGSLKTVSNILTLLISMLNEAERKHWVQFVPRIRKPKTDVLSKNYRYLKTKGEIRRFLCAVEDEGEMVYAAYATAVLTGMRAGEIAGLQCDDVDFANNLITIRRSYATTPKNGKTRHVPILHELEPVLSPRSCIPVD